MAGFPFRHKTARGKWAWRLRHSKWIFFALYVVAGAAIIIPSNSWSVTFLEFFGLLIALPYFASMLLSPVIGNRGYCRYLCPFGATFGALNRISPYHINFDDDTCTDCGVCNRVCDMGIPVLELGRGNGKIDVADCMGCGRCVSECKPNSLAFHDVRSLIRPTVVRNRSRLRDWAIGALPEARWHAWAFAAVLLVVVAGAWWFSRAVGTPHELQSGVSPSICLVHS